MLDIIKINFELDSSKTSDLDMLKYVKCVETDPIFDENGTLTLNFKADGLYFTLFDKKLTSFSLKEASNKLTKSNCAFTVLAGSNDGTATTHIRLVIQKLNVSDNVDLTLTIKVGVNYQPLVIERPYLITKAFPVDTRLILTKEEMVATVEDTMPDIYFTLCKDDGHFYLYNKAAEKNDITGKFTLITDHVEKTIQSLDGGEIAEA